MGAMNSFEQVEKQYQSDRGLNIRIQLHSKYSVNKQGYGNWIMEQYAIAGGMKILELGCGNGSLWLGHAGLLEKCDYVCLTDFSAGMLQAARENLGEPANVTYQAVDIQNIPFPNEEFDIVIANNMLYHVPDLDKGLQEVKRVLKPDGTFYCATGGKNSPLSYAANKLMHYGVDCNVYLSFDLDSGTEILSRYFSQVEKRIYEDALKVTNADDLVDYLYSGITFPAICPVSREELKRLFMEDMTEGFLYIPKDCGMFVCQNIEPL